MLRGRDEFTTTIVNLGDGVNYHPVSSESPSGKVIHGLSLRLKHIPVARAMSGSFWFLIVRPLLYEQEDGTFDGENFGLVVMFVVR